MERKLVSGNELCKLYKVSAQTVRNWRLAGLPSYKRQGAHRRYDLDEVSAWLTDEAAQKVAAK